MANEKGREALRGVEAPVLDLIAEVLTQDQWAGLLKAPLERAAFLGSRDLAQKLVRAGAEIGDALHVAVEGGKRDIANDLLENGTSVETRDIYRNTPLHVAAQGGQTEMVQLLLRKGADIDAAKNSDGLTPLLAAVFFQRTAAALALLAAGADVSHRHGTGSNRSVAHMAANRGDVDILRAAIEHGVDVNEVDTDNNTPLHLAASTNTSEAIDILVEAGANIDAKDGQDSTPLHHAAKRLSLVNVTTLLKHGADVNARDSNGQTPLHYAARTAGRNRFTVIGSRRAAKVVDLLLRSGADETITSDYGKQPVDVVIVRVVGDNWLVLDVEHVRKLLANAPADRAWRRRGYLVLCRAHPDRLQLGHGCGSAHAGSMAPRSLSDAKMAKTQLSDCSGNVGCILVADGRTGGSNWAVTKLLEVKEEGLFRTIVGYL